jgi:hypothetical protein
MSTLLYLQQYGALFEVRVTTTIPVNAWQGRLVLPGDLKVQDISYGAGIGDIWQTPPVQSGEGAANGIDFVGGATVGFSGDGLLFQFTALPPVRAKQMIGFDAARTKIYGGGQGTPLAATLRPITVNSEDLRLATSSASRADTTVPEPFTITMFQNAKVFAGKPAVVFYATDKGSGIDHYEVEEYARYGKIGWHRAESPYMVGPDMDTILVKAVDRAGNYRVETIVLRERGFSGAETGLFIGFLLIVGLLAVYFMRQWRKNR